MANVLNLQTEAVDLPQEAKASDRSASFCAGAASGKSWAFC